MARRQNVSAITQAIRTAQRASRKATTPSPSQAVQSVGRAVSQGAAQTTRRAARPKRSYKVGASVGAKVTPPRYARIAKRYDISDEGAKSYLKSKRERGEKRYERGAKRKLARQKKVLDILMAAPFERAYVKGREGSTVEDDYIDLSQANKEGFYSTPDILSRSNFKSYAKELWPELGLRGKRPKLDFRRKPLQEFDLPGGGKATPAAQVPRGKNKVVVGPETPASLQLAFRYGNKSIEDYYRLLVAHEFAHTRQRPIRKGKLNYDQRLVEGGADEFARQVGPGATKRAGYRKPKFKGGAGYGPYRKYTRKHRSKKWIKKGQFG